MIDNPVSPFLECTYYCPESSSGDAFAAVLAAALKLGAQPTGKALVVERPGARALRFRAHTDLPEGVEAHSSSGWTAADLLRATADSDTLLLQVGLVGAILEKGVEILTYTEISAAAVEEDVHPIAIWTSGWDLQKVGLPLKWSARAISKAQRTADRTRTRFLALAEAVQPAYAAITMDYALPCAFDLVADPVTWAFGTFFVSAAYLGAARLAEVERLFEGAAIEVVPGGLYISCDKDFNAARRQFPGDATERSEQAAQILANIWTQRHR